MNLLTRGFGKLETKFKWYSWLRFKDLALKGNGMEAVMESESVFMDCIKKVHDHYRCHPNSIMLEGWQENKGPQKYEDRKDKNCYITMGIVDGTNGTNNQLLWIK